MATHNNARERVIHLPDLIECIMDQLGDVDVWCFGDLNHFTESCREARLRREFKWPQDRDTQRWVRVQLMEGRIRRKATGSSLGFTYFR